jgi:hypothetical protein
LRADFANNANGVGPAIATIVCSLPFAAIGEWLAREARRDFMNDSTPGTTVEGSGVVPNGRVIEEAIADSGFEHLNAVGIAFDVAHDSVSEQPF